MIKVLANDGISKGGKKLLEENHFHVDDEKIPQNELEDKLNQYDVVFVRSATKISKKIIEAAPKLKLIGRAGVGLDNIDVDYAKSRGIKVINTPEASSASVAELTIAHLYVMARFLHDANRKMPVKGSTEFKKLKKSYAEGTELAGKTLGIIGLGRIGKEVAKRAIGLGMNVIACNKSESKVVLELDFHPELNTQSLKFEINTILLEDLLAGSDFISLHVPTGDNDLPIIGKSQFEQMKSGACIVNVARGGVVNEKALLEALDSGKLSAAALDVFENEPQPNDQVLNHPRISLSPHIGASTQEAQERIGIEIAQKTINFFQMHETV